MVWPAAWSSARISHRAMRLWGSRPAAGSPRRGIRGRWRMARGTPRPGAMPPPPGARGAEEGGEGGGGLVGGAGIFLGKPVGRDARGLSAGGRGGAVFRGGGGAGGGERGVVHPVTLGRVAPADQAGGRRVEAFAG